MASTYELKGKYAIVTGGGSGINLAITQLLLENGCSVMIADLRLLPEADGVLQAYPHPPPPSSDNDRPSVLFHQTDITQWTSLNSLWTAAMEAFGQVNILINGAGIIKPSSSFWHAPGVSPLAGDAPDQGKGSNYKILEVNTVAPIRLAQMAIGYWLENKGKVAGGGNILWISSLAGYMHSLRNPLYHASKAAVVSTVKCLGPLRDLFGIRNVALCPGAVRTPLVQQSNIAWVHENGEPLLEPKQVAAVAIELLTESMYGNGNIIEVIPAPIENENENGTTKKVRAATREIPMEALYGVPEEAAGMFERDSLAMNQQVATVLEKHGMRSGDDSL